MHVILYTNGAPPNKVDKKRNLSNETTFEGVKFIEKGALDILNPSILLKISDEVSDVSKYNYLRIPKFNRYYYIDKISAEGGLWRIDARCDVLMSHKQNILDSKQYIMRQETKNTSPYLLDDMLPIRSDHNYLVRPFGDPVQKSNCVNVIMATTGKGGTPV